VAATLLLGGAWVGVFFPLPAAAMHEVDHRFTVAGHVCGADGRPVPDLQVIAKDQRASIGGSAYTDSSGFYKVTLHLHSENRGDPIVVTARDQEQRVTAQFDAKDVKTERKVTVNFGSGCETSAEGTPQWVFYSVGAGLVTVAVLAGVRLVRKQRRSRKREKGSRKQPGS
jgi:hypothetical protein